MIFVLKWAGKEIFENGIVSVYVGCCLSEAPPPFLDRVMWLKDQLRDMVYYRILDFYGGSGQPLAHPDIGGQGKVYRQDIVEGVGKCDLLVAVADERSTGLGLEIGAALWLVPNKPKPILLLSETGRRLSAIIADLPTCHPKNVRWSQYLDQNAMLRGVFQFVDEFGLHHVR